MVDLETLLRPVFDDSPDPASFNAVRARAATIHRRRLIRITLATVVSVGIISAGVAAIALRSTDSRVAVIGGTGETRSQPTASNNDVLVFDDGYNGVLVVDLNTRVAVRRVVTGQRAGDQPFRSILTGDALVVGWGDVYAAPLATGRSHRIGRGVVIPSETPGRVWLTPYGGIGSTYQLVDLQGHVLLTGPGLPSSYGPVAIPGGLAFAEPNGISRWDARHNDVTATLGTAGAQPGTSFGDTLAWSQDARSGIMLTSTTTLVTHRVVLPGHVTGIDVSLAQFSNNGRFVAVPFSTAGAANGANEIVIVDVAHARVLRTLPPLQPHATFAWSADSQSLYLASSGYQQTSMTIRRVDITNGQHTDTVLPIGGGINFHAIDRSAANLLLRAPTTRPADCQPPDIQPSGRTQPCRFHY